VRVVDDLALQAVGLDTEVDAQVAVLVYLFFDACFILHAQRLRCRLVLLAESR
jgi:hypothetical protein